ncbi:MAG: hypothetical protein H6741_00630 [Alphaproteobacteria bacterium]|nr:hypothetical protein [Alphaproteobacteria bacterium]MCB9791210.1 hypothetical protein [Alphaproteobacteria bacterium]
MQCTGGSAGPEDNPDIELVLGEVVEAAFVHDTRLGRGLDHLVEAGTDRVLGEPVTRYPSRDGAVSEDSVHLDTTSPSVYRVYDLGSELELTFASSSTLSIRSSSERREAGEIVGDQVARV